MARTNKAWRTPTHTDAHTHYSHIHTIHDESDMGMGIPTTYEGFVVQEQIRGC
jgi:hypothetical protein